jgi:5-formyltetrahydrofolate cyclo-ligase
VRAERQDAVGTAGGVAGIVAGDTAGDMAGDMANDVADAKRELRAQILAARRRLPPEHLVSAASALADVLIGTPEVAAADVVTAYVSIGTEPGTGPLLERLASRGVRILLPVLRPDGDVEWTEYGGPESLRPAGRGLLEPVGPRLGVDAVASAGAVLVPGLAADRAGVRLGRGGGSYDRVLARVPPSRFTAVLLYDNEILDAVPAGWHDRTVRAAATPGGLVRLGRPTV